MVKIKEKRWCNKTVGTVSACFPLGFFIVLMCNLLRVDPHGPVDLFEKEQSCVFRFPEKVTQVSP